MVKSEHHRLCEERGVGVADAGRHHFGDELHLVLRFLPAPKEVLFGYIQTLVGEEGYGCKTCDVRTQRQAASLGLVNIL